MRASVGVSENRSRRLAAELVEGEARVIPRPQEWLTIFDERPNERPELVQSRTFPLNMLFECERQLGAFLELAAENDERPEDETAQEWIEMGRTHGHVSRYATDRSSPLSCGLRTRIRMKL